MFHAVVEMMGSWRRAAHRRADDNVVATFHNIFDHGSHIHGSPVGRFHGYWCADFLPALEATIFPFAVGCMAG